MEWSVKVAAFLSDDRLLANLIAVHILLVGLLLLSFMIRHLLQRSGQRFLSLFGFSWLRGVTEEATGAARDLVYWLTLALMAVGMAGGAFYHFAGRDIRADGLALWHNHVTIEDAIVLGVLIGKLLGIAVGAWF